MITGIELPPDRAIVDPDLEERLRIIQPALLKVRFSYPPYLRRLDEICPDAWFISRPEPEGYTAADMIEGYRAIESGFMNARLIHRLLGHEIANEPNHTQGPYASEHGVELFARELDTFFASYPEPLIPLISASLQPYWQIAQWVAMLDRFGNRWRYRAVHGYWQGARVTEAIDECLIQRGEADLGDVIVTEFGDATSDLYEDTSAAVRISRCRQFVTLAAVEGFVASTLFIIRAPDPRWQHFVHPAEQVREILTIRQPRPPIEEPLPMIRINPTHLGEGFRELYTRMPDYVGMPQEGEWSVTKEGEPGEAVLQTVRFAGGTATWNRRGNYVTYAGDDGTVIRVRAPASGQPLAVTVMRP